MKSKKRLDNIYSRIAKIYDHVYGPFLEKGRDTLFESVKINSGVRILEVGIGTGLSLAHYPKDAHVIGIDINDQMLHEAHRKAQKLKMKNVQLLNMSAEELRFDDNTFDLVACPSVLSVVPHPDKALTEMIRVCKPQGQVAVVSHFTGESAITRLIDKGFNPISANFLGFHMNTPRSLVENNKYVKVLKKEKIWFLNFSHLYLLEKK